MISTLLASLSLMVSPVMAQEANADDQAIFARFQADIRAFENNLPSSSDDVSADGSKCDRDLTALIKALPIEIQTNYRCDVNDFNEIVLLGGARLRQ